MVVFERAVACGVFHMRGLIAAGNTDICMNVLIGGAEELDTV